MTLRLRAYSGLLPPLILLISIIVGWLLLPNLDLASKILFAATAIWCIWQMVDIIRTLNEFSKALELLGVELDKMVAIMNKHKVNLIAAAQKARERVTATDDIEKINSFERDGLHFVKLALQLIEIVRTNATLTPPSNYSWMLEIVIFDEKIILTFHKKIEEIGNDL